MENHSFGPTTTYCRTCFLESVCLEEEDELADRRVITFADGDVLCAHFVDEFGGDCSHGKIFVSA